MATVQEKSSSFDRAELAFSDKASRSEHSRISNLKSLRGRRSLSSPNLRLGIVERLLSFGADDGSDTSESPSFGVAEGRSVRAQYNALIMPEKVVLIRHGQSMGNINEELYSKTPGMYSICLLIVGQVIKANEVECDNFLRSFDFRVDHSPYMQIMPCH